MRMCKWSTLSILVQEFDWNVFRYIDWNVFRYIADGFKLWT